MARRTLAAALLLALVVAGCTDDPEPQVADPTPTPSGPTSSSAPVEPRTEPTDEPPEDESAEAFIRRWQEATFRMQTSGDTEEYLSFVQGCAACSTLVDQVTRVYESGGSITSGGGSITSFEIVARTARVTLVEYELRSEPTEVRSESGTVEQRFPGGLSRYQVNLRRLDGRWHVIRVSQVDA